MSSTEQPGTVTKLPEFTPQDREMASNHSILASMVVAAEAKLKQVQHSTLLELTNQKRQQDDHDEKIKQQRVQLQTERQAHLQQIEAEKLAQRQEDKRLQEWEYRLNAREKDVRALEQEAEPLKSMKASLTDLQFQAEHRMQQANDLMSLANAKLKDADNISREMAGRQAAIDEKDRLASQKLREAETVSANAAQSLSSATQEIQRLTALQQELEPRLAEFQKRKDEADAQALRAESLMREAQQKLAEATSSVAQMTEQAERLHAKETALLDFQTRLTAAREEVDARAQALPAPQVSVPSLKESV